MENQYTVRFDQVPYETHDQDDEYFERLSDAEHCGRFDDVYIYAPRCTPGVDKPLQRWEAGKQRNSNDE